MGAGCWSRSPFERKRAVSPVQTRRPSAIASAWAQPVAITAPRLPGEPGVKPTTEGEACAQRATYTWPRSSPRSPRPPAPSPACAGRQALSVQVPTPQSFPQAPQFAGSVARSATEVSQPLVLAPSQSTKPAKQTQAPSWQEPWVAASQMVPQAPQLAGVGGRRSVAQPSSMLPVQWAKPPVHTQPGAPEQSTWGSTWRSGDTSSRISSQAPRAAQAKAAASEAAEDRSAARITTPPPARRARRGRTAWRRCAKVRLYTARRTMPVIRSAGLAG